MKPSFWSSTVGFVCIIIAIPTAIFVLSVIVQLAMSATY
jgi:hypothetical protein